MEHQEKNNLFTHADLSVLEPDYGTGMRKLRGILDFSQKEAAIELGMTQQQLSQLEKKKQWSEEMQQRVSEKMRIPRSGFDYLARERDLLQLVVQHNTFTDQSHSCMNNYATYNIGSIDKAEEIISKIENLVSQLGKNTESLKKTMTKKK